MYSQNFSCNSVHPNCKVTCASKKFSYWFSVFIFDLQEPNQSEILTSKNHWGGRGWGVWSGEMLKQRPGLKECFQWSQTELKYDMEKNPRSSSSSWHIWLSTPVWDLSSNTVFTMFLVLAWSKKRTSKWNSMTFGLGVCFLPISFSYMWWSYHLFYLLWYDGFVT